MGGAEGGKEGGKGCFCDVRRIRHDQIFFYCATGFLHCVTGHPFGTWVIVPTCKRCRRVRTVRVAVAAATTMAVPMTMTVTSRECDCGGAGGLDQSL